MKKFIALTAVLVATTGLVACKGAAPAANNTAAPKAANTAAPAAPPANAAAPAGNAAGPAAPAGDATNQNFTLNNRSQSVITHLRVSPVSQSTWGPDILGRDVLAAGESAEITFPREETACQWDIQVTVDGTDQELRNVNLCTVAEVNYPQ